MTGVAFHPTKNLVASCSSDKSVKLWNADTGAELWTVRAHSKWVRAVVWSPCGQWLASGGDDRMIFIYDANTFEVKSSLNVGYAFSRFSTRISVRVRPLFSRFGTRISV